MICSPSCTMVSKNHCKSHRRWNLNQCYSLRTTHLILNIVNKAELLESPVNIKGASKDAKIQVGRSISMNVQNLLFCAHTQCMNCVTNMFLLVSSSVWSKQLLCFLHGQGQKKRTKPTTKSSVSFHNHTPLLTMLKVISHKIGLLFFRVFQ